MKTINLELRRLPIKERLYICGALLFFNLLILKFDEKDFLEKLKKSRQSYKANK